MQRVRLGKLVWLPEISPGLFLSNRAFLEAAGRDDLARRDIRWLINVSQRPMPRTLFGGEVQVSHHPLPDSRYVGPDVFFASMRAVAETIAVCEATRRAEYPRPSSYLIFCDAGTNRSCAAAVFVAISTHRFSLAGAIAYLETSKERAMESLRRDLLKHRCKSTPPRIHWDSLTNAHFTRMITLHLARTAPEPVLEPIFL